MPPNDIFCSKGDLYFWMISSSGVWPLWIITGFIFQKFNFLVWQEIITSSQLTQPQIIAIKIGPAASIGKKFSSPLPAWNYCAAWVLFSSTKIITPKSKTEEIIHCKYLFFFPSCEIFSVYAVFAFVLVLTLMTNHIQPSLLKMENSVFSINGHRIYFHF